MRLKEIDVPKDPAVLFHALQRRHRQCFLLESAEGPRRLAQYSFLGFDPAGVARLEAGEVVADGDLPAPREAEGPLDYLGRVVAAHRRGASGHRYLGGLVGYLGYEVVEALERLPPRKAGGAFPDMEFGLYLDGVVYDHAEGTQYYFSHAGDDRSGEVEALARERPAAAPLRLGPPRDAMGPGAYGKAVERAQGYVRDGDAFQVVLSRRVDMACSGDLGAYYDALRATNPSPYMYHLGFGEREIVGSSPEMLARVEGDVVETFPIAGTRPLGDTAEETARLAAELQADEKERAEHAMLVDLARNDVGRVARYGTVEVPELARVERYSHVQHMVSRVTGRLREGLTATDALAAVFPAGTVSGAPKVRAMEIINELEAAPRGPYAGAVGYFSLNGNMDTAITIRTLTRAGDTASVQAGAGIVMDSDPRREYEETRAKQRALLAVAERFRGDAP